MTVVTKACEIPPAMSFGSPVPNNVIAWKVLIIPVTVPSSPSSGATTEMMRMKVRKRLSGGISFRIASSSFRSRVSGSAWGLFAWILRTRPSGLSVRAGGIDLGGNLPADEPERNETLDAEEYADDAENDRDVPDQPALLDAVPETRGLDEQGQDRAPRGVDPEIGEPFRRLFEIVGSAQVASGRLLLELEQAPRLGCILEITPAGNGVEHPDADHRPLFDPAIGQGDLGRELHDLARLGHLPLELEPELLDLSDRRDGRGLAHFLRKRLEKRAATGKLDAGERGVENSLGVARHLLEDTEKLLQGAEALVERLPAWC